MTTSAPCSWCDEPLMFTSMGWLHEGGNLYAKECKACGLVQTAPGVAIVDGEPAEVCSGCGSAALVDDHCGTPDRSRM